MRWRSQPSSQRFAEVLPPLKVTSAGMAKCPYQRIVGRLRRNLKTSEIVPSLKRLNSPQTILHTDAYKTPR
jgi:hypothetical protein